MRIFSLVSLLLVSLNSVTVYAFDFQQVIDKAKNLAEMPYQQPAAIPKFLRELKYSDYQNIRFKPDLSLWRESGSRFQVMLICPGLFYGQAVTLNLVEGDQAAVLPFKRELFSFADPGLEKRISPDLGYAGFKLTYPLKSEAEQNQFLVFAGASYFRAVGRDNTFGLSARGAALNTGLSSGEEFPSFVEYWLVKPAPGSGAMVVHALMDSKSLTGAYTFTITPGAVTAVEVKTVIFPRTPLQLAGIAPLTSMFYYGDNTGRPIGEWRRQVHDSDGLLIENGSTGEWLWRPVLNPKNLLMDYFQTDNVRGFGLIQRDAEFSDYLDPEAQYHHRPSIWVEPKGDWGKGQVVLVQLPTPDETNDNIVAFWTPADKPVPGKPVTFEYLLKIGDSRVSGLNMAQAVSTLVGDGNRIGGGSVAGAYRFIVDFAGGGLESLAGGAEVLATVSAQEPGEILDHYVEYVPDLKCWRLSMLARASENKPLLLRAFLHTHQETLTETWTYRLEAENDIHKD